MNTILTVASVLVSVYVAIELGTMVYILKNRSTAIPRIRASLRYFLGTGDIANELAEVNSNLRKLRVSARKTAKVASIELAAQQNLRNFNRIS